MTKKRFFIKATKWRMKRSMTIAWVGISLRIAMGHGKLQAGQICGGRCSKSGLGAPNIAGSAIWKAGGDTERPERLGRAGGGKGAWGAQGTPSKARARQDKAQRKRDEVFLLPYIYFLRALLSSPDSFDQCVNRYAT